MSCKLKTVVLFLQIIIYITFMFVISLFPISKKVKSREIGYDNLAYKHCLNGHNGAMCKNTAFAKFPVIWLT